VQNEGRKSAIPPRSAAWKYALFIVVEILLGIGFCAAVYFYYFRK